MGLGLGVRKKKEEEEEEDEARSSFFCLTQRGPHLIQILSIFRFFFFTRHMGFSPLKLIQNEFEGYFSNFVFWLNYFSNFSY